jgi:hypothetical protein
MDGSHRALATPMAGQPGLGAPPSDEDPNDRRTDMQLEDRRDATPRRALVLGAGGPAASAWETGVIAGLAEAGVDVRKADLIIGTSAGSRVAARITSGLTLEELFQ